MTFMVSVMSGGLRVYRHAADGVFHCFPKGMPFAAAAASMGLLVGFAGVGVLVIGHCLRPCNSSVAAQRQG
jgi:hypothetical protein